MAAKLVAEEGSLKGLVLSLEDGDQWIIGRDPDMCQLLVEDPSASRKHLICRTTSKGILLENLSATNPTEVNDEQVKEPRLLQHGDAVKIGEGVFRYYAEAAAHLFKDDGAADTNTGSKHQNGSKVEQPKPVIEELEEVKQNPSGDNGEGPQPKNDNAMMPLSAEEEDFALIETPPEELQSQNKDSLPTKKEGKKDLSDDDRHDTIFDEEPADKHALAEINFGLLDTGRWLIKVVGGPNNGAEFSMQTGSSYVIGTDPHACDIVFHDTSVSRQHARITVKADDTLVIEDLKSRNGTIVEGNPLTGKRDLPPNTVISTGTTSFVVFDREGEMQTIISPLIPSIVKVLQKEEPSKATAESDALALEAAKAAAAGSTPAKTEEQHHTTLGAFILIGILTGLFVIVGIGTTTLFKSEPIVVTQTADPLKSLDTALSPYPSVKYSFNTHTGKLLLVGHVLTATDRSQLLYAVQGLNFIKTFDDSGIIIDEYVWREINQVIEKNPEWKGVTVIASTPGHFVVSGYLKARSQSDRLSEYLSANFPYPDLLEKKIIVDEDITSAINNLLQTKGLNQVTIKFDNGEVTLSGHYPNSKAEEINDLLLSIKNIRGVRNVRSTIAPMAAEQSIVNISDKYEVTGISIQGSNRSVVINGRILMKGDTLDGMTISSIQPHVVFLEREGVNYRIDFNK